MTGLTICFGVVAGARADLLARETALHPGGQAYEVNRDNQGLVWISDYKAGQVWGYYPEDAELEAYFEVYPVLGHPSDARHDGQNLWWADGESNILGQASTTDGAFNLWEVPGVTGFNGTALDTLGRLWATAAKTSLLYRLDPLHDELCVFTLPIDGKSDYILSDGGFLWLGDRVNERLLRLKVAIEEDE